MTLSKIDGKLILLKTINKNAQISNHHLTLPEKLKRKSLSSWPWWLQSCWMPVKNIEGSASSTEVVKASDSCSKLQWHFKFGHCHWLPKSLSLLHFPKSCMVPRSMSRLVPASALLGSRTTFPSLCRLGAGSLAVLWGVELWQESPGVGNCSTQLGQKWKSPSRKVFMTPDANANRVSLSSFCAGELLDGNQRATSLQMSWASGSKPDPSSSSSLAMPLVCCCETKGPARRKFL